MPIDLRKCAAAINAAAEFTAAARMVKRFHPDLLSPPANDFWILFQHMPPDDRAELLTELRELNDGAIFAADFLPLFERLPREWQTAVVENLAQNYG